MTATTQTIDRGRFRRITRFFARVILHLVWWDLALRRVMPARVRRTRPARFRQIARRFRELAVQMGGVMIKAGQFLSSRVDVLPPEITEELAGLQDEVPPEPQQAIRQVISEELGGPPELFFAGFEDEPQAAASLGQTHRAWLGEPGEARGDAVVIKVQRLGIERLVETDLAALRVVARWVMLYPAIRRRADVPALVEEFARTTWQEIDYQAEADNAERFQAMFADDPSVRVPAVYRDYTTRRVLALENVESIKITDLRAIAAAGVSRTAVAARLFDTYLKQIFGEGFFHADPHPGNLFVEPLGPAPPLGEARPFRLTFVDFGMVGRVPVLMGEQFREIMLALTLRDAHRLTQAFKKLGFLLPGADLPRIEEAVAHLLDHFWGMNLEEMTQVDYGQVQSLALEFRDLLFDLPFQVPHDFIFLGRTIGILSGLSTLLDPQFNPWHAIERYGQGLLRQGQGWPAVQQAFQAAVASLRPLVSLPLKLDTWLTRAGQGEIQVEVRPDPTLARQLRRLERATGRLLWGIVFSALALAGTWLYVDQAVVLAVVGWALALAALLLALVSGRGR